MGNIQFSCDHGSITLRDNYWDSRAFGANVMEITEWDIFDNQEEAALKEFDVFLNKSAIQLCLARIPLSNQRLTHLLQTKCNFLFTEVSLAISIQNMRRELISDDKLTGRCRIRDMRPEDVPAIQDIAAAVFRHGRFAEDTLIDPEQNKLRQKNWVVDLVNGPEIILVSEDTSNNIASFMAYKNISENHIELILGGSADGQAFSGVFFWHDLMARFAASGIKKIDTIVSAANISVLRLYESLGFKVTKSWAGLHWHRTN